MDWPSARNIFNIFKAICRCSYTPGPWRATSGPSAHALMQHCCVNLAKRIQHHATSKLLHENFDSFQIWSNMLQHFAARRPNVCNMLCPTMLQDVALKCCQRLARPLIKLRLHEQFLLALVMRFFQSLSRRQRKMKITRVAPPLNWRRDRWENRKKKVARVETFATKSLR